MDPVKRKVITRWSMESVERYIKISNDPLILKLTFDVIKRNNCVRKYTMDYADAQVCKRSTKYFIPAHNLCMNINKL